MAISACCALRVERSGFSWFPGKHTTFGWLDIVTISTVLPQLRLARVCVIGKYAVAQFQSLNGSSLVCMTMAAKS